MWGLWYGPNMRHKQKSVRLFGFVGLWFAPNLTEVGIELSINSIDRRAVLLVCGMVSK
jgi:hypothetical protein